MITKVPSHFLATLIGLCFFQSACSGGKAVPTRCLDQDGDGYSITVPVDEIITDEFGYELDESEVPEVNCSLTTDCDDHNADDHEGCASGESADGSVDPGTNDTTTDWDSDIGGVISVPPPPPECGDGIKDRSEPCDGSSNCTPACKLNVCGDGHKIGAEQCDDGNTSNNDGCSSSCRTETATPPVDEEEADGETSEQSQEVVFLPLLNGFDYQEHSGSLDSIHAGFSKIESVPLEIREETGPQVIGGYFTVQDLNTSRVGPANPVKSNSLGVHQAILPAKNFGVYVDSFSASTATGTITNGLRKVARSINVNDKGIGGYDHYLIFIDQFELDFTSSTPPNFTRFEVKTEFESAYVNSTIPNSVSGKVDATGLLKYNFYIGASGAASSGTGLFNFKGKVVVVGIKKDEAAVGKGLLNNDKLYRSFQDVSTVVNLTPLNLDPNMPVSTEPLVGLTGFSFSKKSGTANTHFWLDRIRCLLTKILGEAGNPKKVTLTSSIIAGLKDPSTQYDMEGVITANYQILAPRTDTNPNYRRSSDLLQSTDPSGVDELIRGCQVTRESGVFKFECLAE